MTIDYRLDQKLAVMLHGGIKGSIGKTGLALVRFAHERVVAVIDAECAGQSLAALTGIPLTREIPIVASVAEALAYDPEVLAIGIAVLGGRLPEPWYADIAVALRGGLSVLNGLHTKLNDLPQMQEALQAGRWIWDLRVEPPNIPTADGSARLLDCKRVLFVGTDMSVGKMSAALAMTAAATSHGLKAKFIATGQTGMMLAGDGFPLDGVRIDFAGGIVQQHVMRHGPVHDVLFIEGQGSFLNPASTATLPLMRGSQPTHLILVHRAGMTHLRDFPWVAVPPLKDVVSLYETVARAAGAFQPAPVVGIALNSHGMTETALTRLRQQVTDQTGLPCDDVVRRGGETLLAGVLR